MEWKNTNIEEELSRYKNRDATQRDLLVECQRILKTVTDSTNRISHELSDGKNGTRNKFDFDLLDTDRIYHLDHIRQICIRYRLRFLDSRYFKGRIPEEAVYRITQLEMAHATELHGFKIIAPSRLFRLADKDDPLLFAPLGNDYFYLIHKWGKDLHPLRKLIVWPFRNVVNLTLLVLFLSYLVTLLIPSGLFSKSASSAEFWIIFFFMFKSLASIVIFYGFALGKNFNPAIWNSKYLN